ncbi:phragmoplast orienting kinesin 2-like [Dorcoceras hygrometricum]|uniref:Phragmoplast orienting kinesin 2-like n=1 Tax=Dorcoceras hygrometricum TaxID=472368 RepID=A0A2Z7BV08_9LAMI|nr:phragmoplast orienting kinesin 2-like [Dorcoceras hygrometricum]
MLDVVNFFHSFSLNKLSDLDGLRDLKEKEKLMLDWAETDSLETAVKRKMYILAKYREMLLRKFLESHRKYYTPGQPWTAMASQIIDLLSDAHSTSLEDLIAQQQEQGIVMFYSLAKSTCWVRPMVLMDGVWKPLQGNEYWRSSCRLSLFVNKKKQPEVVIEENFVPHVVFIEPVQYWGAAQSLIKTWGWARVCTEIVRYNMFGCLRPVRVDVCKDIVVYSLAIERIPARFCRIFAQGVYTEGFVGYFSDSEVQSIPDIDSDSSDGCTVYRSPSPISQEADSSDHDLQFSLGPVMFGTAQEEQSYIVENPDLRKDTLEDLMYTVLLQTPSHRASLKVNS